MIVIDFSKKSIWLALHERWCLDHEECLCGPGDILASLHEFIGETFPDVPLGSFTTGRIDAAR